MPGDDSEHANFLHAKMELEERRMKRINEVREAWLFRYGYKSLCDPEDCVRRNGIMWLYLCIQIMKEWAEADNQSKELPIWKNITKSNIIRDLFYICVSKHICYNLHMYVFLQIHKQHHYPLHTCFILSNIWSIIIISFNINIITNHVCIMTYHLNWYLASIFE